MKVIPPIFISYSRRDYYFAESLAFHLQRAQIPVWLDAKDLEPGVDWLQQLEEAIDSSLCVLLVVSSGSLKRPSVRVEWERALRSGKRIIIVRFRGARLPVELSRCEVVDFRASFNGALKNLIRVLNGEAESSQLRGAWLPLPPSILAILLSLLVPLISYFLLANWNTDEGSPGAANVVVWVLLPMFAFGFFWFFGLAFLRRKMGMSHLAGCFIFPGVWSVYPLVRYWIAGPGQLPEVWRAALIHHPVVMEVNSAMVLIGLGIILLARPEDLLRWTPTGKAWGWYRRQCLLRTGQADTLSPLRRVKQYTLLHDAVDGPAAKQLRQELTELGASEHATPSADFTTIVLLTSRTHTLWLDAHAPALNSKILTVVGSRIGLPDQFAWLWKREWIDFRHWSLAQLDKKQGLPQVPEAVSNTRYPRDVRVVHQLLCAMVAATFCVVNLAEPALSHGASGHELSMEENAALILMAAPCIWCGILAQRLLNRTVEQSAFYKSWKMCFAGACVLTAWAMVRQVSNETIPWRLIPWLALLISCPVLIWSRRNRVAFWFPSPGLGKPGPAVRLAAGQQWQTLVWSAVYVFFFGYFAGMYNS